MVEQLVNIAAGTGGILPAGAPDAPPPRGGRHRAVHQVVGGVGVNMVGEHVGPAECFGVGDVAGGFDKRSEAFVDLRASLGPIVSRLEMAKTCRIAT